MVVAGGMGAITQQLAHAAIRAGVHLETGSRVQSIQVADGMASAAVLTSGAVTKARVVLVNADPFVLRNLVGEKKFTADFNARLSAMLKNGTTMKVNEVPQIFVTWHIKPQNCILSTVNPII